MTKRLFPGAHCYMMVTKCFIFVTFLFLPQVIFGQKSIIRDTVSPAMMKMMDDQLQAALIRSEIDRTAREVAGYDKSLRKTRRHHSRLKDRVSRLEYKVVKHLARIDTTVAHRPTFAEWQLTKAERALSHDAGYIANTEQLRREKIQWLGEQTKELQQAETRARQSMARYALDPQRTQVKAPRTPKARKQRGLPGSIR
jgi:chromosome segregation ATPase